MTGAGERPTPLALDPRGLCPACAHARRVVNDRGSVFLRCGLAREDPRYTRYPPQPVRRCDGFRE